VFVDWFNRVWKVPPNAIEAELATGAPDHIRVAALEQELRSTLDVFESLLAGRDYLMSDAISAADCAAFPFLKYAKLRDAADDELFHRILVDNVRLDGGHPRLSAWIDRVNERRRA
jgi:maleylpyruvate isomerase